ncbi:hypothetical protein AVEN_238395-1 [Araneus ventricosus]|uniref:Uncharacterized protein n=1 Tax=Araneus ventricosus TaxID=182803 RepID=A0A4Y2DP87_ARAVE|nr:hypothetical protein AVEN_238395-1 [Araneus ventricosus]
MYDGTLMEPDFEPGSLLSQFRDLTTRSLKSPSVILGPKVCRFELHPTEDNRVCEPDTRKVWLSVSNIFTLEWSGSLKKWVVFEMLFSLTPSWTLFFRISYKMIMFSIQGGESHLENMKKVKLFAPFPSNIQKYKT